MPIYSFAFVLALACAALFYKAGEQETESGLAWAGVSIVVSALIILTFHGGVGAVLLGQLAVLAGITLWRTWRDPR
jgi:hypothetical protein